MKFLFRKKHILTDMQRAASLIWGAVSPDENLGGRDDCIMELSKFDYAFVQAFLEEFVCREDQEEILLDSAGESLWEIWKRKKIRKDDLIAKMGTPAKKFFKKI